MRQLKSKKRDRLCLSFTWWSFRGWKRQHRKPKKLLTNITKEKGCTNLLTFCDNGISGDTMERDGYKDMIKAILDNKVSAVFAKDLLRLRRNYIEAGKLTEKIFSNTMYVLLPYRITLIQKKAKRAWQPVWTYLWGQCFRQNQRWPFCKAVRKCIRTRKLTPRLLNGSIEKIEFHQSEKIDRKII